MYLSHPGLKLRAAEQSREGRHVVFVNRGWNLLCRIEVCGFAAHPGVHDRIPSFEKGKH